MALNLSKTGIVDGQVITAAQITQSIDALTAAAAYNITISGSFAFTGNTTGSGYFNNANVANAIRPGNVAASGAKYTVPYLASTGSTSALYYSGTGPKYDPIAETLISTNFEGTASFATTASHALNAGTPSSVNGYIVAGGPPLPSTLGFIAGSDFLIGGVAPFLATVSIPLLAGKVLGSTAFITATISGSAGASGSVQVNDLDTLTGDVIFQGSAATAFYYHVIYR